MITALALLSPIVIALVVQSHIKAFGDVIDDSRDEK